MGIKSLFLRDKNGTKFYPHSHADSTYDRNGIKVGVRLDMLEQDIADLKDNIESGYEAITDEEIRALFI